MHLRSHDLVGIHSANSTPSPDYHPDIGAFPPRPSPSPPPPTTSLAPLAPPTTPNHTLSYYSAHNSHGNLSHQQSPCLPGGQSFPSQSSVGDTSSSYTASYTASDTASDSPNMYNLPGHIHPGGQSRLPPSHVTSSSDSSVFTYGSPSNTYSDSTQTTPPSSQTRSTGSECSVGILHFSYVELSEATGGFTEGMVGIGAFGTVFKAKIRGNGPYAIKKLHTVSS